MTSYKLVAFKDKLQACFIFNNKLQALTHFKSKKPYKELSKLLFLLNNTGLCGLNNAYKQHS